MRSRHVLAAVVVVGLVGLVGGCASQDTKVVLEQTAPPATVASGATIPPISFAVLSDRPTSTMPSTIPSTVPLTVPSTVPLTVPLTEPSTEPSTTTTTAVATALPATSPTTPPPTTPRTVRSTPSTEAPRAVASTSPPSPTNATATTAATPSTARPTTTQRPTTSILPTSTTAAASTNPASTTTAATGTGPKTGPGFDGTTIRLGLLTTTQHPIWGTIGRAITAGIEARVAAINRKGGIAGRYRIELVKAETNYDPTETANQLQSTKDRVAAYVSILGTPSVEATEPLLRSEGLLAAPASQEARWADARNLLPVFNSYQVQALNGVAYFVEQFAQANPGIKPTVCGVSVGTSFGEAGTEGIKAAAARLSFTLGPIVNVSATETSFVAAASTLRSAGCHATFLTVGPAQTLGLVLTGRQVGLATRWIIMGASFSDRIVTSQTGPLFEQSAWVVGDGTQWGDATVPGMVQMQAELLAANHRYWTENPDVGLSFGWAQARTLEAVLEAAVARGDLSRSGILAASASVGTVDIGGIGSPIDYSQSTRLANARTTIFSVDNSYRNAIRVLARDYTSPAAAAYRR